MVIEEEINGLYRCEALFGNWGSVSTSVGHRYFDRKIIDFGKELRVTRHGDPLFEGRITALEGIFPMNRPRQLRVYAEDRFQDLRMTRRTRSFENLSDADLITAIANEHRLKPEVNLSGEKHRVLAQVNQSDLAFLRERARSIDAELWVEGGTLKAEFRRNRGKKSLKMDYGSKMLRDFSVMADLAGQRTALRVTGWDVAGKSGIQHEATESVIRGELAGGISGASVLSAALGERKESVVHTVPLTSQEAQVRAESFFRMTARRFLVGRGTADTVGALKAGGEVELGNLGPLFDGKYYLTGVKHIFEADGMRTEFTCERPGLGRV